MEYVGALEKSEVSMETLLRATIACPVPRVDNVRVKRPTPVTSRRAAVALCRPRSSIDEHQARQTAAGGGGGGASCSG